MAISLARARRVGQQRTTGKKLAAEYAAQAKKAQKRKGWSGLLGKGLGMGLGSLLAGGLGIASGGLLMPLVMAAGSFGGKKIAHEMTRGMGAKTGGLKGDMYGYGEEEAMSLRKDLESQMAVDPSKERGGFGKELLSSYISAGMAGKLGGAKQLLKGDITGKEALLGTKDWEWGGAKGAAAGFGDLFGTKWGGDGADADVDVTTPRSQADTLLTTGELDQSELFGGNFESVDPVSQALAETDTSSGFNILDLVQNKEQGGQVMDQQQLMQLLALMSQQQTAYSDTPLEEEQQSSIADHFASQGKTLGGNNTQSLSQMLGR